MEVNYYNCRVLDTLRETSQTSYFWPGCHISLGPVGAVFHWDHSVERQSWVTWKCQAFRLQQPVTNTIRLATYTEHKVSGFWILKIVKHPGFTQTFFTQIILRICNAGHTLPWTHPLAMDPFPCAGKQQNPLGHTLQTLPLDRPLTEFCCPCWDPSAGKLWQAYSNGGQPSHLFLVISVCCLSAEFYVSP